MRILTRTAALLILMLGIGSGANAQVSFGFRIGEPPAPRVYRVPAQPDPSYEWIEGYWYPVGSRYEWHDGYWSRAPFAGAYWVAPWHQGGRYYAGYWAGERGRVRHNDRWERNRQRQWERQRQRESNRR